MRTTVLYCRDVREWLERPATCIYWLLLLTISGMHSRCSNGLWKYRLGSLLHFSLVKAISWLIFFFFFPCCCSEFNQSTSEEIKCGESDQHADPGFVLYSPGNGPCEFCRCLIMEQNTRRSRLVPWLQQWVFRHWASDPSDCRASQALTFTALMHKIRNKRPSCPNPPHLTSILMT